MTLHYTNIPADHGVQQDRPHRVTPNTDRRSTYRNFGKRAIDLTLLALTCWIVIPVIAILALMVLVTGQSPFYGQKRIGYGGKVFYMWKLRTMLPRADERLEEYLQANPSARAEWDAKQKLINDPRVTPIGRWLRKSSLDELPQLFNVLNGTMSLVGPRPMMVDQRDQYHGTGYFEQRPGLTGLWQVSDRNNCDFVDRVLFDEEYNNTVSLSQDVAILAKTVMVVARGTGC